jgi:hypothetical protein
MPKSKVAKKKSRLIRRAKVRAGLIPPRPKRAKSAPMVLAKTGAYYPVSGAPRTLSGRGAFADWFKYIPRALGGAAGLISGGLPGAKTGWNTGADVSKAMGFGAYNTNRQLIAPAGIHYADPVPRMHSTAESCNICRTEYLGDVITSGVANAFSLQPFNFNPGIFLNWGSTLASLFQEWQLNGAVVSFRTRSSSYSNTTTLGTIVLAMDYNATATAFTTKQQIQECGGSVAASLDRDCDLYIEAAQSQTPLARLYVRTGSVPSGSDQHLYDMGLLQVATSGCPNTSANVGELYISYDITFFKPVSVSGSMIPTAYYSTVSISNAAPLGTATKLNDTIGLTLTSTSVTFPAGTSGLFYVVFYYAGNGAVATHRPTLTATNATANLALISPPDTTSSTNMVVAYRVLVTNPSTATVLTLAGDGTLPTSSPNGLLLVTELNSSLTV